MVDLQNLTQGKESSESKIIAISGLRGSGKTTLANHLCNEYGYKKIKFSDPAERIARELLGMEVYDRDLIAKVGNCMRKELRDFQILVMEKVIQKNRDKIVIEGLRFAEEHSYCKSIDCLLVNLTISAKEQKKRLNQRYSCKDNLLSAMNHPDESRIIEKNDFHIQLDSNIPTELQAKKIISYWGFQIKLNYKLLEKKSLTN